MNQWANQAKAGTELRLDPCHLPQTVIYQTKTSEVTGALNEKGISIIKNHDGVSRLIPAKQFRGVAASTVDTLDGQKAVALKLYHDDEEACVPLLVSRDLDDVLLDWRLWADIYDLPMLLIDEDGTVVPVQERSPLQHFFQGHVKKLSRFMLRCRGASLGIRLVVANQVMLG